MSHAERHKPKVGRAQTLYEYTNLCRCDPFWPTTRGEAQAGSAARFRKHFEWYQVQGYRPSGSLSLSPEYDERSQSLNMRP